MCAPFKKPNGDVYLPKSAILSTFFRMAEVFFVNTVAFCAIPCRQRIRNFLSMVIAKEKEKRRVGFYPPLYFSSPRQFLTPTQKGLCAPGNQVIFWIRPLLTINSPWSVWQVSSGSLSCRKKGPLHVGFSKSIGQILRSRVSRRRGNNSPGCILTVQLVES